MIRKPCQCAGCGKAITANTKTGCCRVCKNAILNARPEFVAARAAGSRAKWQDPEHRAKMFKVHSAVGKANGTYPVRRARLVEAGKTKVINMHSAEARAKVRAKQEQISRKISERAMAWCPVAYRDQYRHLTGSKNLRAPNAKAIILAQIRKDQDRELAKLTPFERQMRALHNGGKLIEMAETPSLGRPGVYRS